MEHIYLRDAAAGGVPGIAYREVEPLFGPRRPPPDFFFGPVPPEFGEWVFNDPSTPGVGLLTVENVELSSNVLLIRDGAALCLPENGLHPAAFEPVIRHRAANQATVAAIDDEIVLLVGSAYSVFVTGSSTSCRGSRFSPHAATTSHPAATCFRPTSRSSRWSEWACSAFPGTGWCSSIPAPKPA